MVHLEEMYQKYKEKVTFLLVLVREANHVVPGLEFLRNRPGRNRDDRRRDAAVALRMLKLSIPAVMDSVNSDLERDYLAWPGRIVVTRKPGVVVHDAGMPIPRGWDLERLEKKLEKLLQNVDQGPPVIPSAQNT